MEDPCRSRLDQPSGEDLTLPVQEHSVEVINLLPRTKQLRETKKQNVELCKKYLRGDGEYTLTQLDEKASPATKGELPSHSSYRIILNLHRYQYRSMPKRFFTFIFNTFKLVDEAVIDRAAFLTPTGYVFVNKRILKNKTDL